MVAPGGADDATGNRDARGPRNRHRPRRAPRRATPPGGVTSPPPFNLNTISRGVSTADFYLAVPTAIVRFLETDTHTKVVAKPQLRGAEGTKLSLKLGQQIPVVSTSYTPIATGGAGVNPLSSYTYQDVGVNIDMTPRVSLDGEIILDLILDNSALGPDKAVAGVTVPTFEQRNVDDAPAAARRRVQPARRAHLSSATRTSSRDFPARFTCRSSSRCSRATTSRAIRPRSSCCSRRTSCARRS